MTSAVRSLRAVSTFSTGPSVGDAWCAPDLDRLVRALNLWRVGADDYLAMAVDPDWPAFPGAQLVAALVTAAERSAPGCRVVLVSWSPGAPPSARRSVRIRVDVVHRGIAGDVTARLTVDQRDSVRGPRRPHGHAIVMLTPDDSVPSAPDGGAPAGAAGASGRASAGRVGERVMAARPTVVLSPRDIAACGLLPPDLLDPSARPVAGGAGPPGAASPGDASACLRGEAPDATTRRALMAYVGAALTVPPGCSAYPAVGARSASATVLASTVAFPTPVAPGTALVLGRPEGAVEAPAEAHAHAMTEFRTPHGTPAVQVSQAALLRR